MNELKHHLVYLPLFYLCIFSPAQLSANPDSNTSVVINGSASFNQQGNTLTITNTPGSIINWQDFSIDSNETTRFIQQSTDSTVLNRVVGQAPSQILGTLQSNGRVFLVNPNGVLFGLNSVIDVNGLAASTLNISNEDFLNNNLNFTANGSNALINNQGNITSAEGGFVYLISPDIENHGIITSPKGEVILAAGHSVQLVNSDNPNVRVTLTAPEGEVLNVGEIITRGGKTSIYAGLINQHGKVNADSAVIGENGKIFFKSSKRTTLSATSVTTANGVNGGSVRIETEQGLTEVSGTVSATGENGQGGEVLILGEHVGILEDANIDASGLTGGGTVLIGGDDKGTNKNIQNARATYVGDNAQIHADAVREGNGGKVIIWSDDATRAYGTITAKGGNTFGNGGYVETSGGYLDVTGINLNVSSSNGSGGTWLLDPYDITISGTTTVNVTAGPTYTTTASGSNILNTDISTQLDAGTAVIVDTTGAGAESGNITVNAAITKSTGPITTLTLKAHNNIITNAPITSSSGALFINLQADQDSSGAGSVTLNSTLSSLGASITISAAGDITLNSGSNTIAAANATVSLTTTNGVISGDPDTGLIDINTGNGSVILNSNNGIYANSGSSPLFVNTSSIDFTNNSTGLVRIYNNRVGTSSVTGTHNGVGNVIIENSDITNPFTVTGLTTNNGYISFRTGTIDITGAVNAGSNAVYLKNYSNGAIVGAGTANVFDLTTAEFANITAGNIFIGEDTLGGFAGTAQIASSVAVDFGGKNIWFRAQNGITFSANNITNNGGELYADNMTTGNITTGSGVITANKVQFRSIGNVDIGSGGITSIGNTYLSGADLSLAGTVNASNLYLYPYIAATTISVGGSENFNLVQSDFLNISSNTVYLGHDGTTIKAGTVDFTSSTAIDIGSPILNTYSTGNITVGSNNLSATGGYLQFYHSGAGIFTSGAGQISGTTLYVTNFSDIIIGAGGVNVSTSATLRGDDVDINGTITAPTVYLHPYNSGNPISVEGSSTYNLTQADLTNINTSTALYIGDSTTTSVDIASIGSVDIGNENLYVQVGGGISIGANSFSAIGGNINLQVFNAGADISTGAGTISSNSVTLTSMDQITIGTGGISTAGAITLTGPGGILQNGYLTTSSASNILATATIGSISMGSTAVSSTNGGNITYTANGNISLGRLYTGLTAGDVTVTSTTGSITDASTTAPDNIFASSATLSAATGIGATGFNVYFNNLATTNLFASTSSGGIDINSKSAMNVGAITAGTGNFILTSTAPGSYITTTSNINGAGGSIDSSDNLTIGAGGVTSAGNLSLIAVGTLSQSGNVTTTVGSILLQANNANLNNITSAGNIGIDTNQISIANTINAGTNGVYIMPRTNNPISIDGGEIFDLTQGEINNINSDFLLIGSNDSGTTRATTASISANASTTISTINTSVKVLNDITFGTNNFTSTGTEMFFESVTGSVTTGAGLVSANILVLEGAGTMSIGTGGINVTAYGGLNGGDISIGGNVAGPIFYLSVFTPGSAISIGGSQAFNVSQSDINNISASLTHIGNNPYVANTNNIDIATVSAIDFGARNVDIQSDNGMLIGGNAFKATGGSLALTSLNTGFDITTGAGNIAADSVTFNSAGDIIVNSGGINAVNSITLVANNTISQQGNLTANGTGTITATATNQDITMAAGAVTTGGNGDIIYSAGNNITVALLDAGLADIGLSANSDIFDENGNGVNNIKSNNLTVASVGNANLDYQIVGALDDSGVTGVSDLRVFSTSTTTTSTASTNEPITTTIDTISDTTNSLSSDIDLTSTPTSTAPLESTGTTDTSTSSDASTTDSTQSSSNTTEEANTTSEKESEEKTKEDKKTDSKKNDKKTTTIAKKLPNCK